MTHRVGFSSHPTWPLANFIRKKETISGNGNGFVLVFIHPLILYESDLSLMITINPLSKLPVFQTDIAMHGYAALAPLPIEGGAVSDTIPCLSV